MTLRIARAAMFGVPSLVAVALSASIVLVRPPVSATGLLITVVAVVCACILFVSARVDRDPFAPLVFVGVVGIVLYVLRPWYILSSGIYGPTRAIDDRSVTTDVLAAMVSALGLVLLALLALAVGYAVSNHTRGWGREAGRRSGADATTRLRSDHESWTLNRGRTVVALAVSGGLALFADYKLVADAGGLHAYISALSLRSAFFFGRGYLAVVGLPIKALVLVILAVRVRAPAIRLGDRVGLGLLIACVMLGDFLAGGRAALLLDTAIPVAMIVHYLRRRMRLRSLLPLIVLLVVAFVAMRVILRDASHAQNRGVSRISLVGSALRELPKTTVGGRDAVPFDSLVVLTHANQMSALPLQFGRTYLAIATFPVPRSLWTHKPLGGGNAWFTQTYFPSFYAQGSVETSISAIGELYANFGPAGVAGGMFLLGWFLAVAYTALVGRATPLRIVLYAVAITHAVEFLRGDAFHSVTTWLMTTVLVLGAWFFVTRRSSPTPASWESA